MTSEATGPGSQLPEGVRDAILADVKARELGRNAIARKHHVGRVTVSEIAKAAGIDDAFDREPTARATRDRQADLRAGRAQLAENLLNDAARIRELFFASYTTTLGTRDGIETVVLDQPDAGALRNLATSLAVLVDKHVVLERHDQDGGLAELGSMLTGLAEKFGLREPVTGRAMR